MVIFFMINITLISFENEEFLMIGEKYPYKSN